MLRVGERGSESEVLQEWQGTRLSTKVGARYSDEFISYSAGCMGKCEAKAISNIIIFSYEKDSLENTLKDTL